MWLCLPRFYLICSNQNLNSTKTVCKLSRNKTRPSDPFCRTNFPTSPTLRAKRGVGVCFRSSSRRPLAPMRNYSNSKLCGIRGWRRCRVAASPPARYYTCIAAKGGRVEQRPDDNVCCSVVRAGWWRPPPHYVEHGEHARAIDLRQCSRAFSTSRRDALTSHTHSLSRSNGKVGAGH